MRILHIREVANVARNLADAQTALGHPAKVLARRGRMLEEPDFVLNAPKDPLRSQLALLHHLRNLQPADVLHVHGGIWRSELVWPLLRRALHRKVFIVQLHGSETRTGKGLHHLEVADRVFCSTPDLRRYVPGAEWLPNPVRVPATPSGIPAGKPVVGHLPTDRSIKGTELLLAAFQDMGAATTSVPEPGVTRLENDAGILVVVENVPHSRALEIMDGCALVVDQINDLGIYSMVSVEAMARGKVALSSYDPALYPEVPPIVRVTPGSLRRTLEEWLHSPDAVRDRGREARAFVQRVHAAEKVAAQALRAYYQELGDWRPRGDELKRYWRTRGRTYRREFRDATDRLDHAAAQERALLDVLRGLEFRSYVEVGCGFGRVLRRVQESFPASVAGVDLSLDQLREARAYVPQAGSRLVAGVLEHLPLRDRSVDVVLASEVLMHLDSEQVPFAVREMSRVARRFIVSADWYEDYMLGEQVQYCFVHDYETLYRQTGFSARRIPLGGTSRHSIFVAERS